MQTKQTILIIGTGNAGSWIASKLSETKCHVLVCDKEFTKAETLANDLRLRTEGCDVEAMECSYNSAWEADIVVIATPCNEQKQVASYIKDVVSQKVVVTLHQSSVNDDAKTIDAELEATLPHSKIVKVSVDSKETALVSGTDFEAVETVSEVLMSAGLVDVKAKYPLQQLDLHQEN